MPSVFGNPEESGGSRSPTPTHEQNLSLTPGASHVAQRAGAENSETASHISTAVSIEAQDDGAKHYNPQMPLPQPSSTVRETNKKQNTPKRSGLLESPTYLSTVDVDVAVDRKRKTTSTQRNSGQSIQPSQWDTVRFTPNTSLDAPPFPLKRPRKMQPASTSSKMIAPEGSMPPIELQLQQRRHEVWSPKKLASGPFLKEPARPLENLELESRGQVPQGTWQRKFEEEHPKFNPEARPLTTSGDQTDSRLPPRLLPEQTAVTIASVQPLGSSVKYPGPLQRPLPAYPPAKIRRYQFDLHTQRFFIYNGLLSDNNLIAVHLSDKSLGYKHIPPYRTSPTESLTKQSYAFMRDFHDNTNIFHAYYPPAAHVITPMGRETGLVVNGHVFYSYGRKESDWRVLGMRRREAVNWLDVGACGGPGDLVWVDREVDEVVEDEIDVVMGDVGQRRESKGRVEAEAEADDEDQIMQARPIDFGGGFRDPIILRSLAQVHDQRSDTAMEIYRRNLR